MPKIGSPSRPARVYGWKPDRPDHRDLEYQVRMGLAGEEFPSKFSQRANWPDPYDQARLGSCTGNGVAGVCHYKLVRAGKQNASNMNRPASVPSRLFIYYFERVLEGTVRQDAGAQIRDGIKVVASKGFCFEDLWPYDDGPVRFRQQPGIRAQRAAKQEIVKQYSRIDNTNLLAIKQSVYDDDPVVFGCVVAESFESQAVASSGLVPLPDRSEQPIGGHCMVIIGWDDDLEIAGQVGAFEVRNSWDKSWGQDGYCFMPYSYLTNRNLANDFWNVKAVP